MSAHTPGPWKADTSENVGKNWLLGTVIDCGADENGRNWIVTTDNVRASQLTGGAEADARLIAAAPDLLAALRGFVLNERQLNDEHFAGVQERLMVLARAAIAKATGEESDCPGHIASDADPKVCGHCGTHIDSLRPNGGAA